jgi:hypothetical protein
METLERKSGRTDNHAATKNYVSLSWSIGFFKELRVDQEHDCSYLSWLLDIQVIYELLNLEQGSIPFAAGLILYVSKVEACILIQIWMSCGGDWTVGDEKVAQKVVSQNWRMIPNWIRVDSVGDCQRYRGKLTNGEHRGVKVFSEHFVKAWQQNCQGCRALPTNLLSRFIIISLLKPVMGSRSRPLFIEK